MLRFTRLIASVALALATLGSAAAQSPEPVSIGVVRLPSSGPVFIAIDKGFFKEEGLEPVLKPFDAAAALATAVVSRDIDFGVTGLTVASFNLAAKGGIKVIASQTRDEPGFKLNAFSVTRKAVESGFKSVKDLPGKRVGITTFGSTQHYTMALIAKKHGIDLSAFTMVPLQTLQNQSAAFAGGQIDAALFPAITARRLEADGSGPVLAWTSDEAPFQLGGVMTSPQLVTTRRPFVEKFVRAYQRGTRAYNQAFNTRDASGRVVRGPGYDELIGIVAKYTNQTPEQLDGLMPFVDAEARIDVASFVDQIEFWKAAGLVDKGADALAMFDLGFVKGHINASK